MSRRRKRRRPAWLYAILLLGTALIIGMGFQVYKKLAEYSQSETVYANLYAVVSEDGTSEESEYASPVSFEELKAINSDIVAWIVCEGTEINYPVAQGEDNSYYLNHLFDGTENASGSIFMDMDNDPNFGDDNTILYGHHMQDGSMFATLENYKEQSFYEEHPEMMLYTADHTYRINIFAGNVLSGVGTVFPIMFADEQENLDYLEACIEASPIDTGITPQAGDQLITLVTCTYDYDNARYAVYGILEQLA